MRAPRSLFALAALPACFGDGPVPPKPADVQVVYVTPPVMGDPCNSNTFVPFIGPLAISAISGFPNSVGYTIAEPDQVHNCNHTGVGSPPQFMLEVSQFDATGINPHGMPLPTNSGAGQSNNGPLPPRLAIGNMGVLFVYTQGGQITVATQTSTTPLQLGSFGTGPIGPIGIATDNTNVYVALESSSGGNNCFADPGDPAFPQTCGGSTGGGNDGLFRFPVSSLGMPGVSPTQISIPNNPPFAYHQMFDVFSANTSGVFFAVREGGNLTKIYQQASSTMAPTLIDGTTTPPNLVPVGIDADDTRVAWAAAQPVQQGTMPVQPGCNVLVSSLPSGPTKQVFHTSKFACLGGALDAMGFFYFAIVRSETTDCNSCTAPIHGDGIGRVALQGPSTFESIATGFTAYASGPRRVLVDYAGPAMYAVDPNAVGKIDKSQIAGRHDFAVEPDATIPMP